LVVSVIWFFLVGLTAIYHGLSVSTPVVVSVSMWLLTLIAYGLLILSGVRLVVHIAQNGLRQRGTVLNLVPISLTLGGLLLYVVSEEWHAQTRRSWFLAEGLGNYNREVVRLESNRSKLSDRPQEVVEPSLGSIRVWATTNADGSLTAWFAGRDGSMRLGYLYHSGPPLSKDPANSRVSLFHLTNGWYEY
jgi:hypothetical protein